jgi:hypothetical protein
MGKNMHPSRFVRASGAVIAAAVLVALAACGGGTNAPLPSAGGAASVDTAPDLAAQRAAKITVKPSHLLFTDAGAASAQRVLVEESKYTGKFKETSTCQGIANAAPLSGKGPSFSVKITPKADGDCAITFEDDDNHSARLDVKVSIVKPTPTPTTTPTATPTGHPTASPSANPTASPTAHPSSSPTANPTASPTASPSPGAITYTCNGGGGGDTSECGSETSPGEIDLYSTSGTGSTASFTSSQNAWTTSGHTFQENDNCGSSGENIANVTSLDGLTFTETVVASPTAGSCTITLTGGFGATLSIPVTYTTSGIGIYAKHRHKPPHK